jgi:hypothetical protein
MTPVTTCCGPECKFIKQDKVYALPIAWEKLFNEGFTKKRNLNASAGFFLQLPGMVFWADMILFRKNKNDFIIKQDYLI